MFDLDSLFDNAAPLGRVSGDWFCIRWKPDTATGEVLNIGVGLQEEDGRIHIQTLDKFDRVRALLGSEFEFHAKLACDVVQQFIYSQKSFMTPPSEQILIERKGFAQGEDAAELVRTLFDDVVSLGRPTKQKGSKARFSYTPRDRLYNSMHNKLKQRLELDYELHVPENPFESLGPGKSLYLPYRANHSAGSLVSASYSDDARVKCNLYDAQRDVTIGIKELDAYDKGAVFILMPGDGLAPEKLLAVENTIDEAVWFMKKESLNVFAESDIDSLADEISHWCEVA